MNDDTEPTPPPPAWDHVGFTNTIPVWRHRTTGDLVTGADAPTHDPTPPDPNAGTDTEGGR